ncbi:MAG TPA: hypothetical protein VJ890_14845 [Vineibacter sp.]|nr:hypothetical protein [Vineibacter sp.]
MSDIALKFPWWIYFFFPPILLADAIDWLVLPLALVLIAAWLAFWRRRLDLVLLALAVVAAVVFTWAIVPGSSGKRIVAGAANLAWFVVVLLPIRWIIGRFLTARG